MEGHSELLLGRVAVAPKAVGADEEMGIVSGVVIGGLLLAKEGYFEFHPWADMGGWKFYEQQVWAGMRGQLRDIVS